LGEKEVENVEHISYLGSVMTNDARCTHQIKSSITTAKAAFNNKTPFTNKLGLNLMKKLVKCYSYGAETLTLWKVDWKYLERLEMR
jgi:hypothetical protein